VIGVDKTRAIQARHLARRFFASLSDERPSPADDRWVRSFLSDGEQELWGRVSAPDQRHGLQVARDVAAALPAAQRPVMAAAALHDVGKLVCGFGTYSRVTATVFWGLTPAPLRPRFAFKWNEGSGVGRFSLARRLAQYRIHPELGRDLLIDAGSDPLTAAWAAEHHAPVEKWSVDPALGRVLKECDDD
jgi:hypothetical protein